MHKLDEKIDTYEAWDEATWPDDIDSSTEADDIELDDVIHTNGPTHTYSSKAKQLYIAIIILYLVWALESISGVKS
jgi:hypothetical protein